MLAARRSIVCRRHSGGTSVQTDLRMTGRSLAADEETELCDSRRAAGASRCYENKYTAVAEINGGDFFSTRCKPWITTASIFSWLQQLFSLRAVHNHTTLPQSRWGSRGRRISWVDGDGNCSFVINITATWVGDGSNMKTKCKKFYLTA